MILTKNIKRTIEHKIGADVQLLGIKSVESAVLKGMKSHGYKSPETYGILLESDKAVYNSFVEDVVVPKTWFFRNRDSFLFLKNKYIKEWKKSNKEVLRVLSIPCSTGEEPYSIAATLFEGGLSTGSLISVRFERSLNTKRMLPIVLQSYNINRV